MTPQQRALLETIKSQCHDWALKEPDCALAYVRVENGAPAHLLSGPPVGVFLRQDRNVVLTKEGRNYEHKRSYDEHTIFFGSSHACHTFAQIATELEGLLNSLSGDFKARSWYEYLFEVARKKVGLGSATIQPATWTGCQVHFLIPADTEPKHTFGSLHNSPFVMSELALAELLSAGDTGHVESNNQRDRTDQKNRHVPEITLSPSDWAEYFRVNAQALRKRLERYRVKNHTGWIEVADRTSREPRYLYQAEVVDRIVEDMKSSSETSSKRPAKEKKQRKKL